MNSESHSNADLTFGGGLVCRVLEIRQRRTYEGLLEGIPTVEMNSGIIASAVREAEEAFRLPVEAIRPAQEPIQLSRPYPFGEPAKIPGVMVLARFNCSEYARDQAADYSSLGVVWFQEEFAFPIAEDIRKRVAEIQWRDVAKDLEW